MKKELVVSLAALLFVSACTNSPIGPSSDLPGGDAASSAAGGGAPAFLVAAGDIGLCGSPGVEMTARLLDGLEGTIVAAGDNAYPSGSADDYRNCYHPSWGRHRNRTRPTPGNHEYLSTGAAPYFEYFGGRAGPAGLGYYSYDLGAWHIVSLNSESDTGRGGGQQLWLQADLAATRGRCTAAYWHRPRFSSGPHGDNVDMQVLWETLYENGVDLVISGHDHLYERFAPQDAVGRHDPVRGMRQFVVGTGGAPVYSPSGFRPNSEALGSSWGVLKLTLLAGRYEWEFIPVAGASYRDAGMAACH
jgi:hypothetical protein